MKIILNNSILLKTLGPFNDIGFVPTMGGIHEGHVSLIKKSIKFNKKTIVSIFVNPKQFNDIKDFKSYPSNIKNDLAVLKKIKKLDFIYIPKFKDIYEDKEHSQVKIKKKDKILCAKYRNGHFEGVLDVMNRLTKLIKPKKIFMGKKDFQQFFLVKNFVEQKFNTKVIGCKIIRNKNKLALSSRNSLLQKHEKNLAAKLITNIMKLKRKLNKDSNVKKVLNKTGNEINKLQNVKIEYLELRNIKDLKISNKLKNSKIFVSFYINNVRLIDNF